MGLFKKKTKVALSERKNQHHYMLEHAASQDDESVQTSSPTERHNGHSFFGSASKVKKNASNKKKGKMRFQRLSEHLPTPRLNYSPPQQAAIFFRDEVVPTMTASTHSPTCEDGVNGCSSTCAVPPTVVAASNVTTRAVKRVVPKDLTASFRFLGKGKKTQNQNVGRFLMLNDDEESAHAKGSVASKKEPVEQLLQGSSDSHVPVQPPSGTLAGSSSTESSNPPDSFQSDGDYEPPNFDIFVNKSNTDTTTTLGSKGADEVSSKAPSGKNALPDDVLLQATDSEYYIPQLSSSLSGSSYQTMKLGSTSWSGNSFAPSFSGSQCGGTTRSAPTTGRRDVVDEVLPSRSTFSMDAKTTISTNTSSSSSTSSSSEQNGKFSAHGSAEFRQFVFDKSFSRIETVSVERSESGVNGGGAPSGASSSFVSAAVALTSKLAPTSAGGSHTKRVQKVMETDKVITPTALFPEGNRVGMTPPPKTGMTPSSKTRETRRFFNRISDDQSDDRYTGRTPPRPMGTGRTQEPPRAIVTSSEFTVVSTMSTTQETVESSTRTETSSFPIFNPFKKDIPEGIEDERENDPFHVTNENPASDTMWAVNGNPFEQSASKPFKYHGAENDVKVESKASEDSLIDTIRQANSRDADHNKNRKPDPSPKSSNPVKKTPSRQRREPQEEEFRSSQRSERSRYSERSSPENEESSVFLTLSSGNDSHHQDSNRVRRSPGSVDSRKSRADSFTKPEGKRNQNMFSPLREKNGGRPHASKTQMTPVKTPIKHAHAKQTLSAPVSSPQINFTDDQSSFGGPPSTTELELSNKPYKTFSFEDASSAASPSCSIGIDSSPQRHEVLNDAYRISSPYSGRDSSGSKEGQHLQAVSKLFANGGFLAPNHPNLHNQQHSPQQPPRMTTATPDRDVRPSGIPSSAIMASMLFRRTNSESSLALHGRDSDVPPPPPPPPVHSARKAASPAAMPPMHPNLRVPSPRFSGVYGVVPTDVHVEGAIPDNISSITEEASTFYKKNFQTWSKTAQDALNSLQRKNLLRHPNMYRAEA